MKEVTQKQLDYLDNILTKMFMAVGRHYDPTEVLKEGWYTKTTWTHKEQLKFGSWLAKHFYNNPKVQRALYNTVTRSKKLCSERATMFVMCYGWKVKDE